MVITEENKHSMAWRLNLVGTCYYKDKQKFMAPKKWRMNGHEVYFDEVNNKIKYLDTDEIRNESTLRPCPKCNKLPIISNTDTGSCIDACFGGMIDGVQAACCGHGFEENAYVGLLPGWRL